MIDLNQWIQEQDQMRQLIDIQTPLDFTQLQYVGGVDISFNPKDPDQICAYLTIMDLTQSLLFPPVYEDYILTSVTIPYISGFLGFREVPFYLTLFERLKHQHPEYYPAVVLVDGGGILHHRGVGSASHLGLKLNLPTIGISKNLLVFDGLDDRQIRIQFSDHCHYAGDYLKLVGQSGQLYGVAYKSTSETQKPIYISIGHLIDLSSAIQVVKRCCQYRIPEPIRNSDIKSKLYF